MIVKPIKGMRVHIISLNGLGTIQSVCDCGCQTCYVKYDPRVSNYTGAWYRYAELEAATISPEEKDRHRREEHAEKYL